MLIMYENLDDFLEELRKEAVMNKTKPIYLSILRPQNPETNVMSAQIYIQFIKEGNALTYQYSDLPDIKIVSPAIYDAVFSQAEDAEKAKKNYELNITQVNDKIKEEYKKIKDVLTGIGYTIFKKAIIQ